MLQEISSSIIGNELGCRLKIFQRTSQGNVLRPAARKSVSETNLRRCWVASRRRSGRLSWRKYRAWHREDCNYHEIHVISVLMGLHDTWHLTSRMVRPTRLGVHRGSESFRSFFLNRWQLSMCSRYLSKCLNQLALELIWTDFFF